MQIDQLTQAASAPYDPGRGTAAVTGGQELGKEAFLKLLVTQLSNQDPLAPADPTEFVSQLAQFTSLEQLVSVNQGLDVLAVSQTAATSAQMVSFVGREVVYRGDTVRWSPEDGSAELTWQQSGQAASVEVSVVDGDGKVVRTLGGPAGDAGEHAVTWDGLDDDGKPLPAGTYRFEVRATDADGDPVTVGTRARGLVTGVTFTSGYPELVLEGGQKVALGEVLEVLDVASGAASSPAGGASASTGSSLTRDDGNQQEAAP